jgi:RimJ/RimL family protein N-acetyltransferase
MDTQAWNRALPPDYTLGMYLKRHRAREFSYDRSEGRFIIEYKPTGDFAGSITYSNVRSRHDATIGIIVHKHFWGAGVAFDAQETLLSFLFRQLGLRVVRLYTTGGNKAAIGLAEKSGFKVAVRQREAVYIRGTLQDSITMDLLREEWFALHPEYDDLLPNPF